MDAYSLRLFQRKAIKSKREILEAMNDYSSHLAHDEEHSSDAVFYRPALIELVNRFTKKVCDCDLVYLEKPFASYEIVITNIGIKLNSAEYTKISLSDDGEIESTESSVYESIICINARFIPVEEFAQRFSVNAEIAIDWIEHQRIKCAEKRPSGWYVMETQRPPSEELQSGSYIFTGEDGDLSSVASLCKGTQVFSVSQAEMQSKLFDVMSFDANNRLIEHRQVSSKELSALENALIRSQDALFEGSFIEVIDEKTVLDFKENPFVAIEEEKILGFVAQLNLPEETKSVLRTIAQDNCGESLFLEVLERLSLKEEFLSFANEAMIECGESYSSMCSMEMH